MAGRSPSPMIFALLAGLTLATPPATRAQGIVDTKESWILSNRSNAKFEQIYGEAGGSAVWVVGKKPKGSGWSLDPTSRGDTVRWVQVTGTLDRKGKVTRIKATEVALVPPPPAPPSP